MRELEFTCFFMVIDILGKEFILKETSVSSLLFKQLDLIVCWIQSKFETFPDNHFSLIL